MVRSAASTVRRSALSAMRSELVLSFWAVCASFLACSAVSRALAWVLVLAMTLSRDRCAGLTHERAWRSADARDLLGELLFDRGDHARIGGLDRGGEACREAAVAADQVFVEIPARNVERPFARGPFVEGVRVRSLHHCLGGEREAHAIGVVGGLLDLADA